MRSQERAGYQLETRVSLLETDQDSFDQRIVESNERISKLLWAIGGLLISVTTACILLAINLVVAR